VPTWLFLLIGSVGLAAIYLVVTVPLAILLGMPLLEVSFGIGTGLFSFRIGGTTVSLGIIPLGSAVQFGNRDGTPPPSELPKETSEGQDDQRAYRVTVWQAVVLRAAYWIVWGALIYVLLITGSTEQQRRLGAMFAIQFAYDLLPIPGTGLFSIILAGLAGNATFKRILELPGFPLTALLLFMTVFYCSWYYPAFDVDAIRPYFRWFGVEI